jgi:uncharacterized protein YjbJ (UPF0337 family)
MNKDTLAGEWKQLKGSVKKQWGKLTDDDLSTVEGNRDQLLGKIQERYGLAKDEAQRQLLNFEKQQRDASEQEKKETYR